MISEAEITLLSAVLSILGEQELSETLIEIYRDREGLTPPETVEDWIDLINKHQK